MWENDLSNSDSWGLPDTIAKSDAGRPDFGEPGSSMAERVRACDSSCTPVHEQSLYRFLSWQRPQTTFATRPPVIHTEGERIAAWVALTMLTEKMAPGGGLYLFLEPSVQSYESYLRLVYEEPYIRVRSIAMAARAHRDLDLIILQAEHIHSSHSRGELRRELPCWLPAVPRNPSDSGARSTWFHHLAVRALRCEREPKRCSDPMCEDYAIVDAAREVGSEFLTCRETRFEWIQHLRAVGIRSGVLTHVGPISRRQHPRTIRS